MENTASIQEEIEDLKKKLQLTDGDQKAYYESSEITMNKNKDTIAKLRLSNKKLHQELAVAKGQAGDEEVILSAFNATSRNEVSLVRSGILSQEKVISKYDQKVCELIKQYNALCHRANSKQKKIQQLQTELMQMKDDARVAELGAAGESEGAQTLRVLENRLDKANIKCVEANHINNTYKQILTKLQDERLEFDNHVDKLQMMIKNKKKEYQEILAMNKDAELAKDSAKDELTYQDGKLQQDKKEREKALFEYRKQADEKKNHAEKVEKRAAAVKPQKFLKWRATCSTIMARSSIHTEEVAGADKEKKAISGEEQERKIMGYEEAMHKIKEATGVSDIQEVVQRFLLQGETQKHLEKLKFDNEKTLLRLREEKAKFQAEFENMKYSGEAKLSSGQRILEDMQAKLEECDSSTTDSRLKLERMDRILLNVKAGIEHLSDKLISLKLPKGQGPVRLTQSTADDYVIDLLAQCEQKLMKLMEDLDGKDVSELYSGMEDEEFRVSIENKLPTYNVRINLPAASDRGAYDDEEESDPDDEAPTRANIKKQAQQIIDQRNKKTRGGIKKKKKM